jgi:hypothetical protein
LTVYRWRSLKRLAYLNGMRPVTARNYFEPIAYYMAHAPGAPMHVENCGKYSATRER